MRCEDAVRESLHILPRVTAVAAVAAVAAVTALANLDILLRRQPALAFGVRCEVARVLVRRHRRLLNKLQVTSYKSFKLQVTSYKSQVTSYNAAASTLQTSLMHFARHPQSSMRDTVYIYLKCNTKLIVSV